MNTSISSLVFTPQIRAHIHLSNNVKFHTGTGLSSLLDSLEVILSPQPQVSSVGDCLLFVEELLLNYKRLISEM